MVIIYLRISYVKMRAWTWRFKQIAWLPNWAAHWIAAASTMRGEPRWHSYLQIVQMGGHVKIFIHDCLIQRWTYRNELYHHI